MVSPKKGSITSQATSKVEPSSRRTTARLQHRRLALQRDDLPEMQVHVARGHERAHLLDRVRRGAEGVAAVEQGEALGERAAG